MRRPRENVNNHKQTIQTHSIRASENVGNFTKAFPFHSDYKKIEAFSFIHMINSQICRDITDINVVHLATKSG